MTDKNGIIDQIEGLLGPDGSRELALEMFEELSAGGYITFNEATGFVMTPAADNDEWASIWAYGLAKCDERAAHMTTYTVTITDGGMSVTREVHALDLEAACELMEREMGEAEAVTDGNPDCEPRTDWACTIVGDDYAACTLRAQGEQDAAAWAKVVIETAT